MASAPTLRLVGGPTALITYGGLRLLTDPTFDPPGEYPRPGTDIVLRKLDGPAVALEDVLPVDAVLVSHDHHSDNLDHSGREMLSRAGSVLTTGAGAERLGGNAVGMEPGDVVDGRPSGRRRIGERHGRAGRSRAARGRCQERAGDRLRAQRRWAADRVRERRQRVGGRGARHRRRARPVRRRGAVHRRRAGPGGLGRRASDADRADGRARRRASSATRRSRRSTRTDGRTSRPARPTCSASSPRPG